MARAAADPQRRARQGRRSRWRCPIWRRPPSPDSRDPNILQYNAIAYDIRYWGVIWYDIIWLGVLVGGHHHRCVELPHRMCQESGAEKGDDCLENQLSACLNSWLSFLVSWFALVVLLVPWFSRCVKFSKCLDTSGESRTEKGDDCLKPRELTWCVLLLLLCGYCSWLDVFIMVICVA